MKKNEGALKRLLNSEENSCAGVSLLNYALEAYNFLKRGLLVEHHFLQIYLIGYLRIVSSEITSTKTCKLRILCIN